MSNLLAGAQVKKFIGPLDVTSGTKTNGANCSSLMSIGGAQFLVHLNVCSKGQLTISLEVQLGAHHNCSRA